MGRPIFPRVLRFLKRSRIVRATGIAAATVFALSQGVAELFPVLGIAESVTRVVVVAAIAAVPLVALGAWALGPALEEVPGTTDEEGPGAAGVTEAFEGPPARGTDARPSLAILPFDDLTDDDDRYFADGVTEEILNAVARLDGVRVAARTSSFAFRDRRGDVRAIARELGVDAVLDGSVRRSGDRLRVSVQLAAGEDGGQLFAETYERRLEDVFEVQDEIARALAHALRVELVEEVADGGRSTRDLEAYRAYLRGSQLLAARTAPALESAVDAFDEALSRDDRYALAHAGRAEGLALLGDMGARPILAALEEAEEAASRAVELAPDLPEGHAVLGLARTLAWRLEGADASFRRAIELGPDYAEAHHWRSLYLTAVGRTDDALASLLTARSLDPLSSKVQAALGGLFYYLRQPERARAELDRALEIAPDASYPRVLRALVLESEGRFDDALATLEEAGPKASSAPAVVVATRARVEVGRGIRPAARSGRNELRRRADAGEVVHFCLAAIHLALGDRDAAFAALEGAVEVHDGWMLSLRVHPWIDPLRDDPRYPALQESLGFDPVLTAVASAS